MMALPPNVVYALEYLQNAGFEAYCVGGCVRDTLLGVEPHDWDITTSATPTETKAVFHGHNIIPTGLKHGTVTVLIKGEPFEITTFRVDGDYSDNRRPDDVTFTRSLRADLARRDFTMNALAVSADSRVIDCFCGQNDIDNRLVRCVGSPSERFEEDALRILRALRFASVLGFVIEESTAKAISNEAWRLVNVSAERINAELTKLLCGENVGEVLRKYVGALSVALPEIKPMLGFDQHNNHHCFDVWNHTVAVVENAPAVPILRWAALLHDIGKPHTFSLDENNEGHFFGHAGEGGKAADGIMQRLKFDNISRERILKLVEQHDSPIEPDKAIIKRKLNRLGSETLLQLLQLKRADNLGQAPAYLHRQKKLDETEALLQEIMTENECFSLRDLAINGNDCLAAGFAGKAVGAVLNALLEAVIDGKVPNEREALLSAVNVMGLDGSGN